MNEELPTTGVPLLFVPIDEVPLDANGKRDRAALLIAPLPVPDADEPYVARRLLTRSGQSLEESVREVWTEVLGIPDIDATTPFFDVGGDSLTPCRWSAGSTLAAEPCHAHVQVGAHDRRPGT